MSDILNFKQGRIADTRQNVEMLQERIEVIDEKIEHHDNQIDKQTIFSKVESIEPDDNLYHMTISVNDGSGSLEVVDKADEDTTDGKMSVVGLNMYKSSIASLMNDVNELKNKPTAGLKFSEIESETEESGVYHTVIVNNNSVEGGQVEIIDTLDAAEQGEKYIVFLDSEGQVVPIMNDSAMGPDDDLFLESLPWSSEQEIMAQNYVGNITSGSMTESLTTLAQNQPNYSEQILDILNIVEYRVRSNLNPDKKMSVVGKNMFESIINSKPEFSAVETVYPNVTVLDIDTSQAETLEITLDATEISYCFAFFSYF